MDVTTLDGVKRSNKITNRVQTAYMKEPIPGEFSAPPLRFEALAGLDANALELFARVVQAGSFARAARKLGQTRAAVSRRVAAMEALVGQPLLARTTRSLGLTEAGRRLAQSAKAVLDAAETARGTLRATQAGLAGRLRITAGPSIGRSLLVPVLAEFQQLHPGVSYELLFTDRLVDLLREGVDVAFRITRNPPEDWIAQPVLPFRISAYASPRRFASLPGPAALNSAPLLLFGAARDDPMTLMWRAGKHSQSVQVLGVAYSEDLESLIALAMAGSGVVITMDCCVARQVDAGQLVDLLPDWHLPLAAGDTVQALTLRLPVAGEGARALVRFVAERWQPKRQP
jgi:DNA-binding transcriptional LysR family regulator